MYLATHTIFIYKIDLPLKVFKTCEEIFNH